MTLRDGGIEMLRQLCESGTCQVREDGLKASLIYEDAWPQSKPRRLKQTYLLMPGDEANFDLEHRGIYLRNDVRDMHTHIYMYIIITPIDKKVWGSLWLTPINHVCI